MRLALVGSILFHIALAALLVTWYFPSQTPQSDVVNIGDQTDAVAVLTPRELPPANDVPSEQIETSLRSAIDSVADASDERKLSELERNVRRLEQVASESSIGEVSEAIRSATGLEERASAPATAEVGGPFDFDSAQFHDVTRHANEKGEWVYRSILLDSKGRTIEVDLTQSEGKTAYETMQMVKASPFAETIYRSMVMPMLDKLVPKGVPAVQPQSAGEAQSNLSDNAEERP
jgi:hypothetical protein